MQLRNLAVMAVGAWLVGCGGEMEGVEPLGTQREALSTLAATSTNVNVLTYACYSSNYMLWDGCGVYGGKDLSTWFSKAAYYIGTIKGTKVSNGQCAAFVINVGPISNMYTTSWRRGAQVMNSSVNVAQGTAIATFDSGGLYDSGHTGIFVRYTTNTSGQRTGFLIWDANWNLNGAVMYHTITTGSSRVMNATNYYVVQY